MKPHAYEFRDDGVHRCAKCGYIQADDTHNARHRRPPS